MKRLLLGVFCSLLAGEAFAQTACTGGPIVCGRWEGPFDWGISAYAADPSSSEPVACAGIPYGEIPHGILFLLDPTASPPEWRVLLVNTADPDLPNQQSWWVWDPATPSTVTQGDPDVNGSLFCSGATACCTTEGSSSPADRIGRLAARRPA